MFTLWTLLHAWFTDELLLAYLALFFILITYPLLANFTLYHALVIFLLFYLSFSVLHLIYQIYCPFNRCHLRYRKPNHLNYLLNWRKFDFFSLSLGGLLQYSSYHTPLRTPLVAVLANINLLKIWILLGSIYSTIDQLLRSKLVTEDAMQFLKFAVATSAKMFGAVVRLADWTSFGADQSE